jgi:hypothetical protein
MWPWSARAPTAYPKSIGVEAQALLELLGERAAHTPVIAVKAALGETLEAAGLLHSLVAFARTRVQTSTARRRAANPDAVRPRLRQSMLAIYGPAPRSSHAHPPLALAPPCCCPPMTPENAQQLEPRVAIVTGGSRGIGRAIVEQLANRGLSVTFTFVSNEAAARAVVESLSGQGHRVRALRVDARDIEACRGFGRRGDRETRARGYSGQQRGRDS